MLLQRVWAWVKESAFGEAQAAWVLLAPADPSWAELGPETTPLQ